MTDGNLLVAAPKDDTTALTGLGIFEDAYNLGQSLARGDWLDAGMDAAGMGMEALGMAMDPVGTLLQYGVSWAIQQCQPLQDCLDKLAGNPSVISSYGETWQNVGTAVGHAAEDFSHAVTADLTAWQGAAADAYRSKATEQADAMAAAGTLANTIGVVVQLVGELVALVRETVRDIIAILVSYLIELIIEELCSVGFATPVVIEQGMGAIARAGAKISKVLTKLMRSLGKLIKKIPEIVEMLLKVIKKLARRGHRAAPPRRGCFLPGTLVLTIDGHRPIEEVRVGDLVLAADPDAGLTAPRAVTAAMVHTVPMVLDIDVSGECVTCSPEHPFWTQSHGWTKAADLRPGDVVVDLNGSGWTVAAVAERHGEFTVHNFEVNGLHSFYVSGLDLLVHNKAWEAPKPFGEPKKRTANWLKRHGVDPHQLKDWLGDNVSHYDIYVDRNGNMFAVPKGGNPKNGEYIGNVGEYDGE